MNAKTFRKSSRRKMRVCKAGTAWEAIGVIEPGTDTFILTFGQFSLIDALAVILDQTGPATVDLSTWTAADAHLERSAEMIESCEITRFRMVIDRSFETRQPGYCNKMREMFGFDCIRAIRTHAKFLVVRSASHDIVVRSSMNLNENPRLENIEISENKEFADFFTEIVDQVFAEVEPGENRSEMLELKNSETATLFPEIEADKLKRSSLNEPRYTHTINARR